MMPDNCKSEKAGGGEMFYYKSRWRYKQIQFNMVQENPYIFYYLALGILCVINTI